MPEPDLTPAAPPPRSRRRWRRALKITLAVVALVAVAAAALIGYGLSERGLPFIVARIVAQSGGRITIDAPTGSVAGTMRFGRITWHGDGATVTAEDVVVDWNPGALWSKRLSIRGLGARQVTIALKPSTEPTTPPTDLQLPLAIDIERLAVAELDWQSGPRTGRMSGLEFGYSGDAQAHRFRELRLVSDFGSLAGNLEVGARAPLRIAGTATIAGDAMLAGARGTARLSGTAAAIGIAGNGTLRDASLALQAVATPFAEAPFANATAELTGVDAASFDPSLPHTRARVRLVARPLRSGIAGTVDAVNEDPGPVDRERLPIAALSSRFELEHDALALDALSLGIHEGGGARGTAAIALAGARSAAFALDVRDLDLARLHTKLVATRMSGRVSGDASAERQRLEGEVRDRDLGLAFRAVVADERVDVSQFRVATAGGSFSGTAQLALAASSAFTVQATMQRLDPSRFAAVPRASLDGSIKARGVLRPRWRADAEVVVADGSRLDGIPVSGAFKGTVTPGAVRDASVELALASAKIRATGAAGSTGDRLTFAVDAPHLAEIAPLLPDGVPRPVSGELHASGELGIAGETWAGNVELRGKSLRAGPYAAATLAGQGSLAPPAAGSRAALATRALSIDIAATQLALPERAIDAAHATVTGTLAQHRATLALRAQDIDASLAAEGSLANVDKPDAAAWSGTLSAFENRGTIPVRLTAPATLAVRAGFVRFADARVDVAGGRVDVAEFASNDGRISTRGAFTGIAIANAARLAGQPLPFESTLVAGGEWSIAAAPRLNGTFAIRRERGDVLVEFGAEGSSERRGVGITALSIAGKFADDALDATASFASERAGTANATVAIGAASGASTGRIDPAAPLRLAVRADLASLAVFQPWFGTSAALGGRARLDVAATGTVGRPAWSGSIEGEALRIDAPPYGISATNGRLRAHLAPTGITLDEVRFTGGDGTFTASGLIALPGERSTAPTRVTWAAENFRAANRPDLRLIVDGGGTITLENRRLALAGRVSIDEGHFEYESSPTGELAPDIVIKGRTPPSRRDMGRELPVALEMDVDLGQKLTFAGEGLETGLAGRVRITTSPAGTLIGRGTIRAVNGTYYAFGQKLTIDRGRLIFDGPLDNPALDVVALRKNLDVEAGVELTGTVKVPRVRVTSNPPVPENEALAWLVTGQGLGNESRVDYAALSAASAALLGKSGKPITARIAQSIGLDDISLQSSGTASGADGTASQVVVFGKRISDRLSLGYEQGLSVASSAVRLEYALSRRVTLRAEAGLVSGVGIVYRRNFQ